MPVGFLSFWGSLDRYNSGRVPLQRTPCAANALGELGGRIFWPGGRPPAFHVPARPGGQTAGRRPKLNSSGREVRKKRENSKKMQLFIEFLL